MLCKSWAPCQNFGQPEDARRQNNTGKHRIRDWQLFVTKLTLTDQKPPFTATDTAGNPNAEKEGPENI